MPEEIATQLLGREVTEPMVITHQDTECLVVSLSIGPPRGFLDRPNAYDTLHEYTVKLGNTIPIDSRITTIMLVDCSKIEDVDGV